jgi:hypothetical protein
MLSPFSLTQQGATAGTAERNGLAGFKRRPKSLPTYRRPLLLPRPLESLRAQKYTDWVCKRPTVSDKRSHCCKMTRPCLPLMLPTTYGCQPQMPGTFPCRRACAAAPAKRSRHQATLGVRLQARLFRSTEGLFWKVNSSELTLLAIVARKELHGGRGLDDRCSVASVADPSIRLSISHRK